MITIISDQFRFRFGVMELRWAKKARCTWYYIEQIVEKSVHVRVTTAADDCLAEAEGSRVNTNHHGNAIRNRYAAAVSLAADAQCSHSTSDSLPLTPKSQGPTKKKISINWFLSILLLFDNFYSLWFLNMLCLLKVIRLI